MSDGVLTLETIERALKAIEDYEPDPYMIICPLKEVMVLESCNRTEAIEEVEARGYFVNEHDIVLKKLF